MYWLWERRNTWRIKTFVCVDVLFNKHSAGGAWKRTKSTWMQRLLSSSQRMETSLPWCPFNPNPQQLLKDANHRKKIHIWHICQAHLFQMQPTRAQSRRLFIRLSKISSVLYISFSLCLDMLKTDWIHNFTLMVYNLHWCMLIINNDTLVQSCNGCENSESVIACNYAACSGSPNLCNAYY